MCTPSGSPTQANPSASASWMLQLQVWVTNLGFFFWPTFQENLDSFQVLEPTDVMENIIGFKFFFKIILFPLTVVFTSLWWRVRTPRKLSCARWDGNSVAMVQAVPEWMVGLAYTGRHPPSPLHFPILAKPQSNNRSLTEQTLRRVRVSLQNQLSLHIDLGQAAT